MIYMMNLIKLHGKKRDSGDFWRTLFPLDLFLLLGVCFRTFYFH